MRDVPLDREWPSHCGSLFEDFIASHRSNKPICLLELLHTAASLTPKACGWGRFWDKMNSRIEWIDESAVRILVHRLEILFQWKEKLCLVDFFVCSAVERLKSKRRLANDGMRWIIRGVDRIKFFFFTFSLFVILAVLMAGPLDFSRDCVLRMVFSEGALYKLPVTVTWI